MTSPGLNNLKYRLRFLIKNTLYQADTQRIMKMPKITCQGCLQAHTQTFQRSLTKRYLGLEWLLYIGLKCFISNS